MRYQAFILCIIVAMASALQAEIRQVVSPKPVKPLPMLPLSSAIVDKIKTTTTLWAPYEQDENPLKDYTLDQLRSLCGMIKDDEL